MSCVHESMRDFGYHSAYIVPVLILYSVSDSLCTQSFENGDENRINRSTYTHCALTVHNFNCFE